jgi:signal transduction histidine kinase/CheY-like chemotaxis protein
MRQPLRVLSIEDEPKDADLIKNLLETGGIVCDITRVENQADFLACLNKGGIDLILADYSLPSFDGISALKLAIKGCPDVPFIFVSGTLGEEVAIEALKIGATDYVLKTSLSRLAPSVERALREGTQKAERKRAEEALRKSEAYLAEAQRLGHTGSFGWKPSTGEIFWSEETFRIFQYDRSMKPTTELILQRVHPEDVPSAKETVECATRDGKDFEHEYRLVIPDGSVKHVHVVARAERDESNEIEFVGAVMDVTERKRDEEALRQAQADLAYVSRVTTMGELTASVAHEVNQPIAAAVTNAKTCLRWLARDQPDVEEARAAALRIVNDGTRAAEIISRIRVLFQKGSQQLELIKVNEVIQETIVLLLSEATQYSISVRTELTADLPAVTGDRVQLQQVVMNLISNGMDAMKSVDGTRELTIKSQRVDEEQLLVSVSDTGVGLPPGQADQIFNAFFTTKPNGIGMGLRICRSIVESHRGRLWATDNSPRGASFHFALSTKIEARE